MSWYSKRRDFTPRIPRVHPKDVEEAQKVLQEAAIDKQAKVELDAQALAKEVNELVASRGFKMGILTELNGQQFPLKVVVGDQLVTQRIVFVPIG